ncbi:hypothetical protein AKJ63_02095, partial [candidate division MSBL1 archaeon SCGC-AAA259D18]
MLEPEVFEELEKTLEEIREWSAKGTPIIVEGKKDERSLRKMGMGGPIYEIPKRGKTLLNSLEDLPDHDEIIVLTDFDRSGEELSKFCEKHLKKLGTTVLMDLRDRLRRYVRKAVKDIEGMDSFLRLERRS